MTSKRETSRGRWRAKTHRREKKMKRQQGGVRDLVVIDCGDDAAASPGSVDALATKRAFQLVVLFQFSLFCQAWRRKADGFTVLLLPITLMTSHLRFCFTTPTEITEEPLSSSEQRLLVNERYTYRRDPHCCPTVSCSHFHYWINH
jgi:hypothetical protein